MTARLNCPTCDARAITTRERNSSKAHGTANRIPAATTDDLWAHLGHITNAEDATRIVRQVIDLGWRPVVGSDPKRLWSAGEPDLFEAGTA